MNAQMIESPGKYRTVSSRQPVCSFKTPALLGGDPCPGSHHTRVQIQISLWPKALHQLALSVLCSLPLAHSPPVALASFRPFSLPGKLLSQGFVLAVFLARASLPQIFLRLQRGLPRPPWLSKHLCPSPSLTPPAPNSFFKIWLHLRACGILVPQLGVELTPPSLKAQSLNHWTAREVPLAFLKISLRISLLGYFPSHLLVKTAETWVQSLIKELRSCMPHDVAKKKTKTYYLFTPSSLLFSSLSLLPSFPSISLSHLSPSLGHFCSPLSPRPWHPGDAQSPLN